MECSTKEGREGRERGGNLSPSPPTLPRLDFLKARFWFLHAVDLWQIYHTPSLFVSTHISLLRPLDLNAFNGLFCDSLSTIVIKTESLDNAILEL